MPVHGYSITYIIIHGVVTKIIFCLFDNVAFIVFKLPSPYFKGLADKYIAILLLTSFINGQTASP